MCRFLVIINGPNMLKRDRSSGTKNFVKALKEQNFQFKQVGDSYSNITKDDIKNCFQSISATNIDTIDIFITAHGKRVYRHDYVSPSNGEYFSIYNQFMQAVIEKTRLENLLEEIDITHDQKATIKSELIQVQLSIDEYALKFHSEDELGLTKELFLFIQDTKTNSHIRFQEIVEIANNAHPDKQLNFIVPSCFAAIIHEAGPKYDEDATFIAIGNSHQPVWLHDIFHYMDSFSRASKHYNGSFTIKKFLIDFLATDFASETLPVHFIPKITADNNHINPEKLIIYGKGFSKAEEQTIHNSLGHLLEKEQLNLFIKKLEDIDKTKIDCPKKALTPKEYGCAMAIGISLSERFDTIITHKKR